MPKSQNSNNNLISWGIIALVAFIVFLLFLNFIKANPWFRWILFTGFITLFVFCIQHIYSEIGNFVLSRSYISPFEFLFSIIGAFFSWLIFEAQVDYFVTWWVAGKFMATAFNLAILAYLVILVISLVVAWWNNR